MRVLFIALAAVLFSGCAFNSETVRLNPTISSSHSSEGRGVSVAVHVIDERPTQSLGHRGAALGAAAEITTGSDVAAIVSDQVTRALQDNGFTVLGPNSQGNARLTVEVRLLRYSTSVGFWTGGVEINAALEARAEKSDNRFEQMYRVKQEHRVVVVPTADKNADWINAALSNVITQLVTDQKLLDFLAG